MNKLDFPVNLEPSGQEWNLVNLLPSVVVSKASCIALQGRSTSFGYRETAWLLGDSQQGMEQAAGRE